MLHQGGDLAEGRGELLTEICQLRPPSVGAGGCFLERQWLLNVKRVAKMETEKNGQTFHSDMSFLGENFSIPGSETAESPSCICCEIPGPEEA